MPAVDPHVLAVGAVDNVGTPRTADDVVADFTSGGNASRRPDVLAPGKSVVSLRVPGSYVDDQHPEGLVTDDASERFFRGSGPPRPPRWSPVKWHCCSRPGRQ